jgi:hypothetical protein
LYCFLIFAIGEINPKTSPYSTIARDLLDRNCFCFLLQSNETVACASPARLQIRVIMIDFTCLINQGMNH